jgi:tetratricopeptide (TPR) repeat protein
LLNQYDTGLQLMQEAAVVVESVEELPLRAIAQMHLGMQLNHCGRFPEGIRILEQSVPVLRSLGYRYGMAYGAFALGAGYMMNGEYGRGEAILLAAFPEAEKDGILREATTAMQFLGLLAVLQGRHTQALEYCQECVQRYRRMQFAGELGMSLAALALAQDAAGQFEAARVSLTEALRTVENTRNMAAMITCLPAMVCLLARRGHLEMALLAHRLVPHYRLLGHSRWYADLLGDEMEAQWRALTSEQQAAIDAAAKGHTPFSIIPQVLALLEPS